MSSPADHRPLDKPPKTPPVPVPSASVLVISPTNQVLLLHRVRTASAFSSGTYSLGWCYGDEFNYIDWGITVDSVQNPSSYKEVN